MNITEIQVNEASQAKIREIYKRSTGSRNTELQGFSTTITLGDRGVSRNTYIQPTGFHSFSEVLSFSWRAVSDKPLLHVLPEFIGYSSTQEIEFVDLLRIFNIEVVVAPIHKFKYPNDATLVFEIRSIERAIEVQLPMYLDSIESSYFISNAEQVARELSYELERFEAVSDEPDPLNPWLNLIKFRGFEFADATDERGVSAVVRVAYKVRFGSFAVDSGFQKLGVTDLSHDHFLF